MLPNLSSYRALRQNFHWQIPPKFNIGTSVCDVWATREPERIAILEARPDGSTASTSYGQLRDSSSRLANALVQRGLRAGDRIAILLPQSPEVAIAHIAAYKLGAIALPLAVLFGVDALSYRLIDAGAKAVITNAAGLEKLNRIRASLPELETIFCTSGAGAGAEDFTAAVAEASPHFTALDTSCDDPAMMIYTSGTTGPPKGALHAHRVLLGHLPGMQFSHEFFPQPGDRLWTPADWAWAGGLLNVLLPGLYFGVPVVCRATQKFEPEAAFALMEQMGVRNAFIPPTALRLMRSVENPLAKYRLNLRTLASAGEALGTETLAWGKAVLGMNINEFYGQTECNYIVASCAALGVSRPGAMGKAVPGYQVGIIREDGSTCAPDELGQIAIQTPNPSLFLAYWNQPEATQAKYEGDWLKTGDQGTMDADGYIHFTGREDDVITSSGFRIGPAEIEDCLLRHSAVAIAAVIGKPDKLRTEIVKAFIVLRAGATASDALAADIQNFVRTRLSAHEYPREIAFVEELPLTTTGKVIRRLLRERG